MHSFILKHCASKITPIVKVVYTQSLNIRSHPADWLIANKKKGKKVKEIKAVK